MTFRSAIKTLLTLALALPIVQTVLIWVGGLLTAMGDAAGAAIVGHVGTACLVVWSISLVGLVILLALVALEETQQLRDQWQQPEEDDDEQADS